MISTKIVKIDPINPKEDYLKEAAYILRRGGLVIIPTETVYGIAANALNKETIERLWDIKSRPKDKPFSLHVDEKRRIEDFAAGIPILAYKLIDKFWPGPLTLVLNSKGPEGINILISPERPSTIGIRMPDNEIALKVIALSGVSVVIPSANLSGKPAPTNFEQAIEDLNGLVEFAIDAGRTELGIESSVVDLTVQPVRLLREGAIKKQDIENTAYKKTVLFVCTGNSCRSVMAKYLLEKRLKQKNRQDVEVLSAGIMMLDGLGATEETRGLLKKEGIDASGHRSQKVTKDIVKKSDIILVMEKLHEETITQLVPEVKNRVFLLKEFAKIDDNYLDIQDPIGKQMQFYAHTFAVIKEAIERVADII